MRYTFTETSHEAHVVSNRQQILFLFSSVFKDKRKNKFQYYWFFVGGIHQ